MKKLKSLLKAIYFLLGAFIGYNMVKAVYSPGNAETVNFLGHEIASGQFEIIISCIGGFIFGLILLIVLPGFEKKMAAGFNSFVTRMRSMPLPQIIIFIIMLIICLIVASLLSNPILKLDMADWVKIILVMGIYVLLIYVCYVICAVKYQDIEAIIRNVPALRDMMRERNEQQSFTTRFKVGRKNQAAPSQPIPKILDTSVIIDGRILDILRTGFVDGPIIIPTFVLEELQYIADSSDSIKRQRGRRGLDILKQIQTELPIEVIVSQKDYDDLTEVDSKLLRMGAEMKGKIITNDYNLNKVAEVQGVMVLNTNELTNAVKAVVLAGEKLNVSIIKEGKEYNQGVAYLDDGTMIVIENGRKYIGDTLDVTVTSVLQTAAGRMIFARVSENK